MFERKEDYDRYLDVFNTTIFSHNMLEYPPHENRGTLATESEIWSLMFYDLVHVSMVDHSEDFLEMAFNLWDIENNLINLEENIGEIRLTLRFNFITQNQRTELYYEHPIIFSLDDYHSIAL